MTVLSTYAALQALNDSITGVSRAPTAFPTKLNGADLPLALTIPGPAVWNAQASGMPRQNRVYYVRFYVAPIAHGEGVDEGFQAVLPILQAAGLAYLNDTTLAALPDVDQIWVNDGRLNDTGVTVLSFAGVDYHGFELRVTVVEK